MAHLQRLFRAKPAWQIAMVAVIAVIGGASPAFSQNGVGSIGVGQIGVGPGAVKPTAWSQVSAVPGGVILRPGAQASVLSSLKVLGTIPMANLRSNPVVKVSGVQVNFAKMLNNTRALPNIAQRLHGLPQLVDVKAEQTQISEIPQGLIVQQTLAYRIKPGTCNDPSRLSQLRSAGGRCYTPQDDTTRAAAFATRGNARYVADVSRRATAMEQAKMRSAQMSARITQHIATLRASFANPAKRAQIGAQLGAAEATRLASLTDAQLKSELVNSGVTKVDQVFFIPVATTRPTMANLPSFAMTASAAAQKSTPAPAPVIPENVKAKLTDHTFLTGFTFGKDYEWKEHYETTISWCIFGCEETYYVEAYAGFNYGFGMRFPILTGGTYQYDGASNTASVTPSFTPINGEVANYNDAGLPADKLFNAKEFVAQIGYKAGFGFNVPFYPSLNVAKAETLDFTTYLTYPLANGQFTPPSPGHPTDPMTIVFDKFDLLGNSANLGVVGAQVFPALGISLVSDKLTLDVTDVGTGKVTTVSPGSGAIPLSVSPKDKSSLFNIGNPQYNLAAELIPGIDAHLFIDIDVWSHSWDELLWFPQLGIKIPSGGVNFACHEGTICTRSYHYGPKVQQEGTSAAGNFLPKLDAYLFAFEQKYIPQCTDDICRTGIKVVLLGTQLNGQRLAAADPELNWVDIAMQTTNMAPKQKADALLMLKYRDEALADANQMVQESAQRLTKNASQGWAIIAQSIWSKQCSEKLCIKNVGKLADQMVVDSVARQKAEPDESSLHVQGEIGREYGPKFQAEINASKARLAATKAAVGAAKAPATSSYRPAAPATSGFRPVPGRATRID